MLLSRWKLSALMCGIAPLIVATSIPFWRSIVKVKKQHQDTIAHFSDISQEAISNVRTVRSFAAEDHDISRYCHVVGDPDVPGASRCWWPRKDGSCLRLATVLQVLHCTYGASSGWLIVSYVIFVVWYAFDLVVQGEMSFGELTAFLIYGMLVLGALAGISGNLSAVFAARGASARVFELIDREPL